MIAGHKLALILSKLEGPDTRHRLLQLSMSPEIASDILLKAKRDIKRKVVYNLGCATGRFAIGSALLGAKAVYGFDVDRLLLDIAKENAIHVQHKTGYQLSNVCYWRVQDVMKLKSNCDTVIQFPPINVDLLFFMKALELGKNVYSIHKVDREEELSQLAKKAGVRIAKIKKYRLTKGFLDEVMVVVAKR